MTAAIVVAGSDSAGDAQSRILFDEGDDGPLDDGPLRLPDSPPPELLDPPPDPTVEPPLDELPPPELAVVRGTACAASPAGTPSATPSASVSVNRVERVMAVTPRGRSTGTHYF